MIGVARIGTPGPQAASGRRARLGGRCRISGRPGGAGRGALVLLGLLAFASAAQAYIPQVDRVLAAIAAGNRASGRTQAIQLEVTMSVGGRPPVARGELVSHPSGLARLELRGRSGRTERYLLSGRDLSATRNGVPITGPRPLLQPIFLLQPDSETTLRAALETFGIESDAIGLAPCGDDDCFVIGDPRLEAPLPDAPLEADPGEEMEDALTDPLLRDGERERDVLRDPLESTPDVEADSEGIEQELEGPPLGGPATGPETRGSGPMGLRLPRLWVDTRSLDVRRIDRPDGSFLILGPMVEFDRLRVPGWLELHEPEAETIRFEVDRAVQVNAPPQAFGRKWLRTPTGPETPEPGAEEGAERDGEPPQDRFER